MGSRAIYGSFKENGKHALKLACWYTNVIEVVTSVVLSKGAQDPVVVCIPG